MSKSIKLQDNTYFDTKGISHNKKALYDIIEKQNKVIDSMSKNPVGDFAIWEGDVLKTGDSTYTWTWLTTFYALKTCIETKYPLRSGFKRTAKIYIVATDNKSSGNLYIRVKNSNDDVYLKEYLFSCTWGSVVDQVRNFRIADFDYANLPYGHKDFFVTPDFATGGTIRIYKIGLLIYDTLE